MRIRLALIAALTITFATPTSQAEELTPRIAVAYDIGFLGDGGFNDAVHAALVSAKKRYNLVEPFVREMPTTGTAVDRLTKLRFLAKSGYTLIITIGSGYRDTVRRVAIEYPEVQFAPINDKTLAQLNISNIYFDEVEEAGIAGTLAALTTKSRSIAIIGGAPDIRAAFVNAARKVSKGIQVKQLDFNGDTTELVSALGKADVTYSLWDSDSRVFEAITAEKARGWYIGRNPDQYFARISGNPRVIAVIEKSLTKPIAQLVNLALQDRALIDVIDDELGIFGRNYGLKTGSWSVKLSTRVTAAEADKLKRSYSGLKVITNQG